MTVSSLRFPAASLRVLAQKQRRCSVAARPLRDHSFYRPMQPPGPEEHPLLGSRMPTSQVHGRQRASRGGSAEAASGSSDAGQPGDAPEANRDPEQGSPQASAEPSGFWGRTQSMQQKLADLGMAGVLAYGLLNTIYYICAFLFFFLVVAKVPSGLGYAATMRKMLEAAALTWAGSQVTKLPRAAGAIAIAPFIDKLLDTIEQRTTFSRQQAFLLTVFGCIATFATMCLVLVAAWA